MKTNIPFLGIRIQFLGLLAALLMGSSSLFGQIHIFPAAPRICLGDTVLLTVVADDPGNIPTFFQWIPSDSLSNPNAQSTLAYPIDTITYFVETNAGGASVTVYVMAPPATSFTGLEDTYYCANTPPITLNGTPSGGVFFTEAASGLSGNILTPATFPTGALYDVYYAIMYGDTSMCTDTVSNDIFVGAIPNATFTGLSASYCSNGAPVTLVPAQEGGTFSIDPSSGGLSGNTLDLSLLSTGINYTITYQITGGDPPCSASSSQSFMVNPAPFASFSGLPGGTLCSNLAPITLTGLPAGGTFFTTAPTGLTGNVLTPSLVPFNTSYTLSYAFTSANGCADTATQFIYVIEQPIASFSGLSPSYCSGNGPIITLTGSPSGGFFTTDVPGVFFTGDVVDLDLNLVPIGTTFTVTYTLTGGGDPPCTGSSSQSFIINAPPTVSFSSLPPTICANTPPITLVGSPAGGTFSTGAPSGLVGNILTPANIPTGNEYSITYTYTDANGCTNSTNQSFLVSALPVVSFTGLSANYCTSSPTSTLVGSPAGGTFSTTAPAGLTGNMLDPSLVPIGIPYTVTYTYTDGIGCSNTDTQTFIVDASPTVSFSGLTATYCSNSAPVTLVGSPSGGIFTTTAPSGLSGNILDPSLVPTGISYAITYTVTVGCVGSSTQDFIVNELPFVSFSGLPGGSLCSNLGPITLTGEPAGGTFFTNAPTGLTGNVLTPSLVPFNTSFILSYAFTAANGCADTATQNIYVYEQPIVSFSGLSPSYCPSDDPIITLTGSPAGGFFTTDIPGFPFSGDVLELDLNLVPIGTTFTVTYTLSAGGDPPCTGSSSQSFIINFPPTVSFSGLPPSICANTPPITLVGSPAGGTFSTGAPSGLVGNILTPANVPTGNEYSITYTYTDANGCTSSTNQSFMVNALPAVGFSGLLASYCITSPPSTLIGSPAGGTFTTTAPTGLTGNTLDPSLVPTGITYTITYTYTESGSGCTNSNTQSFIVNAAPTVSFSGLSATYCTNSAPVTLVGSPAGGVFSTTAPSGLSGNVLSPSLVPIGISYSITYTVTSGCVGSNTQNFIVNPLPVVNAGTYAAVCINAAPVALTGSPSGGTFSGIGVTGNTFNPAVGTQTITYTFTNANGCVGSSQTTITVNPLPVVSAGTYAPVCINAAPVALTGSPAGGTFSGTGVTGNTFNPAVGTQTITYTFTNANGCTGSNQTTITVNPLPVVSAGTYTPVCINAAPVALTGSPVGGTFSGTGVTGNSFNPAVGTQTITYTFTNANGCTGSSQTTITVNPLPVVSAGTYTPVCINAAPVALTGSPVGGTFSSTGVIGNSFNPAVGTQTITYTFTNANGCTGSNQTTITVNPLPIISAGTYTPVCINAAPVALTGSPAGGTFSGTGVTGNTFNPAVGTQTITYTFTNANGCTGSSQTTITVNPLPVVGAGTYTPVCINAAPVALTGSPVGGTFSGTGVTGNSFNPAVGTQTITYTFTNANGCTNSSQTTITVNPLPVVSAGTYVAVCINAAPVALTGSPVGGTFSGTGVIGNSFNPAVGTQTITYTFTNANGCTGSNQTTITVNPLPVISAGTYSPVCINAAPVALTGSPAGGTFSGTGVTGNSFNPAVGTQTITYTFTNANGCTGSSQTTITVHPLPPVDAGTYPPVCITAPSITLEGSPTGGIFSGIGVTGNSFDPAVGTQTITYTFTNANGCTGISQTTITVNPSPVVSAGTYAAVCINAAPVALTGSPAGGTFSGTGVTGNTFNPAVGTQTITYTFTNINGCTNSSQTTITVNQLPVVSFTGLFASYCPNSSSSTLIGSPAGGTFTTNAPSGLTGNILDPSLVPTGITYNVTYTYTNVDGCTNSSTQSFIVNASPAVGISGLSGVYCANAAPVTLIGSPGGGVFTTTAPSGLSGNILSPSLVPTGILYSITYTANNGCVGSNTQSFLVNPLPIVSAGTYAPVCTNAPSVALIGNPLGGTFSGIGVTGNSFTPIFGTQTITYSYTNANGCTGSNQTTITVNPLPVVSAGTYTPVCINAAPVTLTGSPIGGTFSGTGVTGNTFNPAVGTQTITYTFTDANGCIGSNQTIITVNPLPIVSAGTYTAVCINAAPVALTGSPIGGTFSGTGVTGNTFNPAVGTQTITYSFTAANGCTGSNQTTITVNPLPVVSAGTYTPVCINAAPITLAGSPIGGTFSGTGVTGNTFNPAVGTQTITYTFTDANGCTGSNQTTITVNPLPVVNAGSYAPVCINAAPITLIGIPAGGTFSGTGVTGNTFNPAVGTQTITYTFTTANGCANSAQTTITVNPLPVVSAGSYAPVCINAAPVPLTGSPIGGTFSGTGVTGNTFNPAVGTQSITYTFTNANGCAGSNQTTITVNPLPVVNAGTYAPLCINAAPITLTGSPIGVTFSGTGVTGNSFNPAVGTQTITYTFTDANGCTGSNQTTITVNPLPVVSAGTYTPVCINAAPITLTGSPIGGIFSGTGVTGNTFNPAVGTQTITYTFTNANGCANSAQTTITVNPLPVVSAGTYAPLCINAPPITLIGSPAGGTFSGTGVTGNSFNPTVGTQTITYTFTNANGCVNSAQTTITVNPLPVVGAGFYTPVCINAAPITLTGSPAGGTFSGTGVTGNTFNPAVGTQTITYTFTDANGCANSAQTTITVNPLPVVSAGTYAPVCINAPPITLIGSPTGGTFSGTGVTGNSFNPAVGTQTITYTFTTANGCTGSSQTTITVNPLPVVNAGTYAPVCINAAPITLTGSPIGGTFSGTGVTGNTFNPAAGTQTVTYSFTAANGCVGSSQTTITVNPLPVVSAGTYAPVCINAAPITLIGSPTGGTFSGTGVTGNSFNPAAGTQTITYTFTTANGCTGSSQTTITVNPLPVVSAGTYAPVCSNAAPITLIGSPAGGTFSGTGVTGNSFNPAVGTQTITYTFTNANGCANSAQTTITVNPLPVVSAGTYAPVCINAAPITLIGSPTGGTFSGTGVTGNSFNPAAGTQTITYTFTNANGCVGSSQTTITVNPLPVVSAGTYAPVCINAAPITLTGSPIGGTFSGTGVTGNSFNPAVGTQTITYSFTNANGCIGSSQTTITVNPLPVVSAGTYTPVCINAAPVTLTGSPIGGIFSGTGVTGNSFNPAVGTQTITYSFTNANGCANSAQTTITVNPLPVVSAGTYAAVCINAAPITLTGSPIGGTFSGTGVTGNSFNPAVGTQTITYTFTTANGCVGSSQTTITVNPLPVVSAGTYAPVCINAAPITLTGSPIGGIFSGTGVTGNSFNPAVGTQTITYTLTNANGCANSAQTTITVNSLPVVSAGTYTPICINAAPVTLTGSPIGGTFSGTGVTGNTFNPAVGTQTITYTFTNANGCTGSSQTTITVNPLPVISAGTYAAVCINAAPVALTGSPAGGTFSGTGVTGNTFNPAVGTQTITYTFTNANGCTGISQTTITVNPSPVVSAGTYAAVCINAAPVALTGSPAGGTFSGTGVTGNTFNPAVGTQTITYTFTNANGCANSAQTTIAVNPLPIVSAGTYAPVCINAVPVTLIGSPAGGTFSGIGVTGNTFNPAVGTQTITYPFTNANGCVGSSQTTITVTPLPVVSAGTYDPVCINAAPITLTGSPAGGTFSGIGVTGNTFNPAVGTQTITYTFTTANGCTDNDQITIIVDPLPVVSAGTYAPVCINAAPIILTGSPVGGTFSGTGVTGNSFNPAVGTQTITYTFTNANGCAGSSQTTITVNPAPIVSAGAYPPLCMNAAPITLTGSPAGGTFSGIGVTGNSFNPAVGTQIITYTLNNANGCASIGQTTITVTTLPVVSAGTYASVCINAAPITLIGSPAGGIFSGTGVTGNSFNPSVGTQIITYTFTTVNGCIGSSQTTITVNPLPIVSAGTYAPACINAAPITLTGSPIGGTFSGTGVTGNSFNPAVGTQTITYNFTNANGCSSSSQTTITVNPLPVVSAGVFAPICINAAPIPLIGSPAGGTYSGTGVTGNSFNPAVGTQTITYTFTNANGCTASNQTTITVIPTGAVNAGLYAPVCIDAPSIALVGTPAGGTFSGVGVTGNSFNPAVGTQTITYSVTNANGCVGSSQTTITVNPLPVVSAGTYAPICINAAPIALIGSPVGGTFSGVGVTGNAFNPSVGTQTITYTFTNANGCSNSSQTTITVGSVPVVNAGNYAPVCINAAPVVLTGSPAGGIFSGTGVTGNSFNPSVGTQTINYTFTNNGCTNSSQTTITVHPIPVVDAGIYAPVCISAPSIALVGSPAGGTFSGIGVTGNSFNPSAGTQTVTYTVTNANGCSNTAQTMITVNPPPSVNAGTYSTLCNNSSPIILIGSPAGGTFSGIGVTGNSFDPSVGPQTITYTFTDLNGCTNSDQTLITVYPLLVVNAGTYPAVCINAPNLVLTGFPSGGTFSGIGVTGNSFDPAVGSQTITYTYTDNSGCSNSDEATITVLPIPTMLDAGIYPSVCPEAADIVLSGTPAGGVFSGIGVSGNLFDPSVGTQTITYTYTNTSGCSNTAQTTITTLPVISIDAGTYATVCPTAPTITLSGSPLGGTFTGTGVTGNNFDPAVGTQTITYSLINPNGCTSTDQTEISIYTVPTIDAGTYPETCLDGTDILLEGTPAGGTFSGIGVTGNTFDPSVGTQTITYTFTTTDGCTSSDPTTITSILSINVGFTGLSATYCADAGNVTLVGNPAGGTFTTNAPAGLDGSILIINQIPTGTVFDITYNYTSTNGCSGTAVQSFLVYPLPVVQLIGLSAAYCADAPPVTLSGTPANGVFTTDAPTGLSANILTPANIPPSSPFTMTYTFTDGNGCSGSAKEAFVINPLPVVNAGTYQSVCVNAPVVLLGGSPANGIFSGIGVSGYTFDPSVGTQTINYTFTDLLGCTNTDVASITVNPLPLVSFNTLAPAYCSNDAPVLLVGNPTGGVFSASLPDALINVNNAPAFQPNALSPNGGTTTLTYTFQSAQGCSATAEQMATVNVAPKLTLADTLVLCGGSGEVVALPNAPDQSYLWSTGATTQSITVAQDGMYSVAVTALNNCITRDTATVFIAAGQQFISNLLVSNTACVGDTVHYFDISEVLTGVDSYFWTFGDGATSLLRDPVHIYTNPGAYEVALTATSLECENVSAAKTIQILSCKQSNPDDIFDLVKVYPNPTEDAFQVDISLNEAKNLLITLSDINGRIIENRLLEDRSLYQIGFSGLSPGVYFVKIQGETQSVVEKVIVL